jgi:hypothetical protein
MVQPWHLQDHPEESNQRDAVLIIKVFRRECTRVRWLGIVIFGSPFMLSLRHGLSPFTQVRYSDAYPSIHLKYECNAGRSTLALETSPPRSVVSFVLMSLSCAADEELPTCTVGCYEDTTG